MEIHVATELTSTTITNILEAVPGIKNVLRSPAADAMVNLTRAAAGTGDFDIKDARELMRFAFRRGLINNEEHDRVLAEVEGAARVREDRLAARRAARGGKARGHGKSAKRKGARTKSVHKPKPRSTARKGKPAARKARPAPKKKNVRQTPKKVLRRPVARKARPAARPKAGRARARKRR
jgi:hypothetical protein